MTADSSIATPWRRDLSEVVPDLTMWVRHRWGGERTLSGCSTPANGMANETILFDVDRDRYVARLAPSKNAAYPTFPTFDLGFQRRCMELVRKRTDVPVPEIVHLEHDPRWLGVPFLVMRLVEGNVPADMPPYLIDGWMTKLTASELAELEEKSIQALVDLHTIREPADLALFDEPELGGTPLEQQLGFQRRYYEWAREGRNVPVIEEAFDILGRTLPAADRTVLNWGDSRIGNIIYRGCQPVAVLDWEMANAGPPEVDLAWMIFFHAFFQEIVEHYGMTGMPDLFVRDRAVAIYERLSGEPLGNLAWYEAFAALRFAIISIRTGLRNVAFGVAEPPEDPDGLVMFAAHFRRLLAEVRR